MVDVTAKEITEAQARIAPHVPSTPVLPSVFLSQASGIEVFLKLENLNISGSFKIRGATNALLLEAKNNLERGVVAASAGNHAQGVAHVCRTLKCKSTIFMPERTPLVKVEATRMMGATVVTTGQVFDDAYQAARAFADEQKAVFIHPYADARVIAGQGTVGLELHYQVPFLDAVIVPIGGGGLISGIACALKAKNPNIKIFGVQTEAFPSMKLSFEGKEVKNVKHGVTIADGIAVKSVADLNKELIKQFVDEIYLVDDEEIAAAIMDLVEKNHLLAEGAGAASIACFLKHHDAFKAAGIKKIACIVSGGNIDITLLTRIADRGLIFSGRLSRLKMTLQDKPGALASLLNVISSAGANVSEIYHNRIFSTSHYSDVEVEAVVETSNHMHRNELFAVLKNHQVDFQVLT